MTETEEAASPVEPRPAKLDPESLALRGRPQRAARFRRSVVIVGAALGTFSLAAIAFVALRPHGSNIVSAQTELSQPSTVAPEVLNHLPNSYGEVPRLGPPLPGDLGKPIFEQKQSSLVADGPADPQRTEQATETERQRQAAERLSAQHSGLMVGSGARATNDVGATAAAQSLSVPANGTQAPHVMLDPATDPNSQQRKADFVGTLDQKSDINPHAVVQAPSPYTLSAGSVIAASLITGLRSDLPGLVTAQVTENVYDSATGSILLVPQGARLIGSYDSVVAFGQKRALVVWQRIVFPDGASLDIDNVPSADASGYAGLEDKVDFHTWALLKGVTVSTLFGIGAQLQFSGGNDLVEAIRQSTQQNISHAGDQLTSKALDIQPTITVRPGAPVRLVVHKDLTFVARIL